MQASWAMTYRLCPDDCKLAGRDAVLHELRCSHCMLIEHGMLQKNVSGRCCCSIAATADGRQGGLAAPL